MEESILEIRIVDYITFLFEVKNGSQLDYLVYGQGYYKRKYTTSIFYPKGITLFDIKEDYYFECVPDYRIHQLKQLQEVLTSKFYLQEVLITVEGKRYHPYFYATPSGDYGAYTPDAMSFGISGGGSAGFFSASLSFSIAATNEDIAVIFGWNFDMALDVTRPGGFVAGSMGFHDNYGDNQDVLVGLGGYDYGWGGQLGPVGMSRTKSAYSNSRVNPYGGVESTMINYGFGLGGGITKSESKVYKLSNGIKKIKNYYNTWQF
ncbi:hypothetical protein [Myroides odoratimimus]|uniref:hypothetical protein n=1 Tax=Myroides odoratimimus TaxID=76832 RepID=UPI00091A6F99|nr:hypothetical protein [Myroides odoratimimus]SHM73431.1 hypothetical protein SAMN05444275_1237 [Myroides odoratimimus subsp. xuanwuensis]